MGFSVTDHTVKACVGQLRDAPLISHHDDRQGYYLSALQECALRRALHIGKHIHAHIIKNACRSDISTWNGLIDMYRKCTCLLDAYYVFSRLPWKNIFTWTLMVGGYSMHGHVLEAIALFKELEEDEHVKPDAVAFVSVLGACTSLLNLNQGKRVHACIQRTECEVNIFVGSSLVHLYIMCGRMDNAWQVFEKMPRRNVFTWTTLIRGHSECGNVREALELYFQMQSEGVKPNNVTFLCILSACTMASALQQGKQVHAFICQNGCQLDDVVGSGLIDMYARCGEIVCARHVFDGIPAHNKVMCWNAMLGAYSQLGASKLALDLFAQMQAENINLDRVAFVCLLSACSDALYLEQGRRIHACTMKAGYGKEVFVGNTLIDMYGRCACVDHAFLVFDSMPERDATSWSVIIAAYTLYGAGHEALRLFGQIQVEDANLSKGTLINVLAACAVVPALGFGKLVHAHMKKKCLEVDAFVNGMIVDMYAKCGSVKDCCLLFDIAPARDVVLWNITIAAYAQHMDGTKSVRLFEEMPQDGIIPDTVTFISLLSGCSHSGLLNEGHHYFCSMSYNYSVDINEHHYACVVDSLSHAGHLQEAEDVILEMPFEACAVTWKAFLGACLVYCRLDMAENTLNNVLLLRPQDSGALVLLSNMYAAWQSK